MIIEGNFLLSQGLFKVKYSRAFQLYLPDPYIFYVNLDFSSNDVLGFQNRSSYVSLHYSGSLVVK
jgi:hypothetical protein